LLAFIVIIDEMMNPRKMFTQKEFSKFIFVLNIITLFIKTEKQQKETEKQQKEILDTGY
jgi:hypothetical protein